MGMFGKVIFFVKTIIMVKLLLIRLLVFKVQINLVMLLILLDACLTRFFPIEKLIQLL